MKTTQTDNEEKIPTREETMAWYQGQIEMAGLHAELRRLQCEAAKSEVGRLEALAAAAQLQGLLAHAQRTEGVGLDKQAGDDSAADDKQQGDGTDHADA
jgi:hypothetical protein